jgi:hypothetical protein
MITTRQIPNPNHKWWTFWRPRTVVVLDLESYVDFHGAIRRHESTSNQLEGF